MGVNKYGYVSNATYNVYGGSNAMRAIYGALANHSQLTASALPFTATTESHPESSAATVTTYPGAGAAASVFSSSSIATVSRTNASGGSKDYVRVALADNASLAGVVGKGRPFLFLAYYCSEFTLASWVSLTGLPASRYTYPAASYFDAWRGSTFYAGMNGKTVDGTVRLNVVFAIGWVYAIMPLDGLRFETAAHAAIPFQSGTHYGTAQINADMADVSLALSGDWFANHIATDELPYHLRLSYGDFGVVAISRHSYYDGGNESGPAYIKDRPDRGGGSGENVCALWKELRRDKIAYFTSVTTSTASFAVRCLGGGKVAFGTSADSSSIFYNNSSPGYSEGDGAWRRVFVPDGAECPATAADGDGAVFALWLRADSLFASAVRDVATTHDIEGGAVELLGVFTENPTTTQTLVVAADGNGEFGSLSLSYADGAALEPVATYEDAAGRLYASYSIPADVAKVVATATPNESNVGVFAGCAADAGSGFGEWSHAGEGTFDIALPKTEGARVVLAAEFRAAELRTLGFVSPSVGSSARVVSSRYGEGSGDDAGKWHEGATSVAITPVAGKRIGAVTLTRTYEEDGQTKTVPTALEVSDNQVSFPMVGEGEFSLSWTESWIGYAFTAGLDAASKGHGAAMSVVYEDGNGQTVPASGDVGSGFSGETTYGKEATITVTPDPNAHDGDETTAATGVILRRAVMTPEGGAEEDITLRFTGNAGVYTCNLLVTQAFSVTVFLGNTFSVATATRESGASADGTAGVSAAADGEYGASAAFTYGDPVYLKATDAPNTTNGAFVAWAADGEYPSNVLLGLGAEAEYAPTNTLSLTALFGSSESRIYLKITNAKQNFGNIGLFAAETPGDVVEITAGEGTTAEQEFNAALVAGGFLPLQDRGGVGRSAATSPDDYMGFTPQGTGDRYYSVRPGALVVAACDPILVDAPKAFAGFKFDRYVARTDVAPVLSGTDEAMPEGVRVAFPATVHGVLSTQWADESPKQVAAFLGSGMDGRGSVSLSPWPPLSNGASNALGMSGTYAVGTAVAVSANAAVGWKFAGWFSDEGCTRQVVRDGSPLGVAFTHEVVATDGSAVRYYAKFVECEWVPLVWEGGTENMEMEWRSKRFAAGQPQNLAAVAIEADGYPVEFGAHYASSPEAGAAEWADVAIGVDSQDARRLPMARPERYAEVSVKSRSAVLKVAASTSMAGLIG